jgi:hypothetical protein
MLSSTKESWPANLSKLLFISLVVDTIEIGRAVLSLGIIMSDPEYDTAKKWFAFLLSVAISALMFYRIASFSVLLCK